MNERLAKVAAHGQSIWIDVLSRDFVASGDLAGQIAEDSVTGLTSNPSIFQKAIASGDAYDEQLKATALEDPTDIFFELALDDIRAACDVFRPVWEATSGGDGYVSMEVDPRLAHDTDGTLAQAVWISDQVDRPNLLVKIPATKAGLPAIEDATAQGISINITLIFSLERYAAVVEAYLRGLERLVADGGDPSKVASVASFFVSRVDTETDNRLAALGNTELQGKLGIANARLAYKHFAEAFSGSRWESLAAAGGTKQRPLWASTSAKNPAYRDVIYVEELIGPDTVNTMPPETVEAFADHGEVRGDTILDDWREAEQLLADLAEAGVDYDDVVETLEVEGVQKFSDSFDDLLAGIKAKRGELAAA
ncbi:MAG TPA: transaldolase [Gaiellaceae bacterium]|nr:transaldolase [Gaiellaceae bacterium]